MTIHLYQAFAAALLAVAVSVSARTFTVAKGGGADYTSVQAAVDAAGPGDEIIITDTAVYEERIVIDSTKSRLRLRSRASRSAVKPVIMFKDTVNVNPVTCDESEAQKITYERNAAVLVWRASGVIIEGIRIDGGGAFTFGGDGIWPRDDYPCFWPLQHGNAALTLLGTGEAVIRDCEMCNAFFGIYIKDRNPGGVFAHVSMEDTVYAIGEIPFSDYGKVGNHLIEWNHIHDNSFGLYFESVWDGGSTVRYNQICGNHHPSTAFANSVRDLTSEGHNQPGGAFFFKDDPVSPVAIYNNTFRHNLFIFIGNWRPGATHLVFNNLMAGPYQYWTNAEPFGGSSFMEITAKLANRMYNSIYAAQLQKPVPSYASIMSTLGNPKTEGDLIPKPFPAEADIRWLETKFLSDDTSSDLFTMPDWSDTLVRQYVVDKGWSLPGVRDPDGSPADIGAVSQSGGRPADVVTISTAIPPVMSGDSMDIVFNIEARIGSMVNPKLTFLRFLHRLNPNSDFGADGCPIVAAANIIALPIPQSGISMGTNRLRIPVPADSAPVRIGFIEMFIEGTGTDGRAFTSSTGFIPYRTMASNPFKIEIWDRDREEQIDEIRAGEAAVIRITALGSDLTPFADSLPYVRIGLGSHRELLAEDGKPLSTLSSGITGTTDIVAVFPALPEGFIEFVTVAGTWEGGDDSTRITTSFFGTSSALTVNSGSTGAPSRMSFARSPRGPQTYELIDLRGRVVCRARGVEPAREQLMRHAANGTYLLRTIDRKTGKAVLRRVLLTGR